MKNKTELENVVKWINENKDSMDQAIKRGKILFMDMPQLGSEAQLIRYEVCKWIWDQFNKVPEDEKTVGMLNFVQRITK